MAFRAPIDCLCWLFVSTVATVQNDSRLHHVASEIQQKLDMEPTTILLHIFVPSFLFLVVAVHVLKNQYLRCCYVFQLRPFDNYVELIVDKHVVARVNKTTGPSKFMPILLQKYPFIKGKIRPSHEGNWLDQTYSVY